MAEEGGREEGEGGEEERGEGEGEGFFEEGTVGVEREERKEGKKEEDVSSETAFPLGSPARIFNTNPHTLPCRSFVSFSFLPPLDDDRIPVVMNSAWYQLALRRYFRRSTFLLVFTFLAISYVALSSQQSYDDFEIDSSLPPAAAGKPPGSSPTGGSIPRPPWSYGITDLKRAMGSLGSVQGGRQQAPLQLRPEQKFTCDSCLSEPERCAIYGS